LAVYILASSTLKYGQAQRYAEAMARLVPIMQAQGWRLLASYQELIGDLHGVLSVWEVLDANAVGAGFAAAAGHADYPSIAAELAEAVIREELRVAYKTPFSP
jgi:NIPSNAP